jgi:DNA-binding MarR family transcriptional regulator
MAELLTQAARPVLQRRGLSLATFELLSAVKGGGPMVSQATIARRLGVTPSTITESARQAVEKGLLTQNRKAGDNRSKCLQLTPLGEEILNEVLRSVNQAERTMVEGIDPDSLKTTIETLRTINGNLARSLYKSSGLL